MGASRYVVRVPPTADVIRTPDQRLRVFVSSTLAELADERAAVARAIEALRLTPVMFELGARPHPPQELYRAYLAQSDIFIGLYWQRYGWVGPGMDISGLEDEFRLSGSLPRLIYLKTPAPDLEPRLAAMIAQLQADATASYRTFKTPRELGRLVREDLATLLSERFAATASRPASPPGGGSCRALDARDVDRADGAGGRHRRGGRPAGVTRGPARHADRSRWHRQDAAGDRRRRSVARAIAVDAGGVRAARLGRRAGARAARGSPRPSAQLSRARARHSMSSSSTSPTTRRCSCSTTSSRSSPSLPSSTSCSPPARS